MIISTLQLKTIFFYKNSKKILALIFYLLFCCSNVVIAGNVTDPLEKNTQTQSQSRKKETHSIASEKRKKTKKKVFSADDTVKRRNIIEAETTTYFVHIEYPSVGVNLIDSNLALWARQQANTFINGIEELSKENPAHYTLRITYQYYQPSLHSCTVIFCITTDIGGSVHPEQNVNTFTYQLPNGKKLTYKDIFKHTDGLFYFLSSYTRKELLTRNWENISREHIEAGTAPDEINFLFFTLEKKGITFYFPPNQVASAEKGTVRVTIPLTELQDYSPNMFLWGRKSSSNE